MAKKEFLSKILVIGDGAVGKSCIIRRYVDNEFENAHLQTVGLDFKLKNIQLDDGNSLKAQIWDTAGQERFHSITRNYFKNAHGIILIYDVTLIESFHNVKNWIKQIKKEASDKVSIILVGNKIDMENERVVSNEEGEKIADEYGLKFFECSAKTGVNIEQIFKEVAKKILENFSNVEEKDTTKLKNKKNQKKGCC
jgi:Ras-related protein Rab-8A